MLKINMSGKSGKGFAGGSSNKQEEFNPRRMYWALTLHRREKQDVERMLEKLRIRPIIKDEDGKEMMIVEAFYECSTKYARVGHIHVYLQLAKPRSKLQVKAWFKSCGYSPNYVAPIQKTINYREYIKKRCDKALLGRQEYLDNRYGADLPSSIDLPGPDPSQTSEQEFPDSVQDDSRSDVTCTPDADKLETSEDDMEQDFAKFNKKIPAAKGKRTIQEIQMEAEQDVIDGMTKVAYGKKYCRYHWYRDFYHLVKKDVISKRTFPIPFLMICGRTDIGKTYQVEKCLVDNHVDFIKFDGENPNFKPDDLDYQPVYVFDEFDPHKWHLSNFNQMADSRPPDLNIKYGHAPNTASLLIGITNYKKEDFFNKANSFVREAAMRRMVFVNTTDRMDTQEKVPLAIENALIEITEKHPEWTSLWPCLATAVNKMQTRVLACETQDDDATPDM